MKNITQFMMDLHKLLKEKREIADITASQYIRTLYSLNSERAFKNLAWLKNTESVELRLQDYAPSTQRNMISTIVSCLSTMNEKASYKKVFSYWYNRMLEKVDESNNKDTSILSRRQQDNWLSWDVVLAHEKRLKEDVDSLMNKKDITPVDWSYILSYMVLSLYTKFAPRRNQDYQFMKVVKTEKQAKDADFNYYVLDTNKFVFNKYKTANSHGSQEFDVPKELVDVINIYLKLHPKKSLKTPFYFLVQVDGSELPSVNSITRILNRIFGKNVGATMLRHIYLSSKYNVEEMNKDAEQMGHTSGMQHEYMKSVEIPEIKS
jgi:hypothetical protein